MDLLVLFGTMILFFAIGVPIGICLIFPCFLLLLVNPVTSASFLAQSFYTGVASSSMIALPFFMICGNIMDKGGISKRLVGAANNCIGRYYRFSWYRYYPGLHALWCGIRFCSCNSGSYWSNHASGNGKKWL